MSPPPEPLQEFKIEKEEIPIGIEAAILKFPLSKDSQKNIEEILRKPEYLMIIIDKLLSELKKETNTQEEQLASYHRAQAYARLIKV